MNNKDIISHIRTGDQAFLKKLYFEYRDLFFAYFYKNFGLSEEQIVDLYQISMAIMIDNIASQKIDHLKSDMKTYLIGIGKNKALESIRKQKNKYQIAEDYVLDQYYSNNEVNSAPKEELIRKIDQALMEMGDPCKSIITQFYFGRLNMKQISENLNYKNSDTVKNIKYKCLARLKKMCRELFEVE